MSLPPFLHLPPPLFLEPVHTHTGEKTPYRYLEPSRDLLEWGRMEGEKRKRIVLSRLSPRKMLLLQFLILINDNEKKTNLNLFIFIIQQSVGCYSRD